MTREEVHNLSPSLKATSEMKSPFVVPEGYFNELEVQVEARLQLNKIRSKNEFSTPEDYFDTVEDSVIAKLKASALQKNSKPQSVPDGYFDNIEDKVIKRLELEGNKKKKKKTKIISISNWKKVITPIAVAASLVIIITLGNLQQEEVTFENLALSEIEYALENNFLGYDSESLLEIFPEVEASISEIELELSEDNQLESYLYETDLSNIILYE